MTTLVLGIGNLLMGDEGIGIHVVRHLEEQDLLPGVPHLDGGTGGFHLLDHLLAYDRILLIDATLDGQPPGSVQRLTPRFSTDYPPALSAHDIGLKALIDALYLLDRVPEVVLFAVTIPSLDRFDVELSPEMAAVVPTVARMVTEYYYATTPAPAP